MEGAICLASSDLSSSSSFTIQINNVTNIPIGETASFEFILLENSEFSHNELPTQFEVDVIVIEKCTPILSVVNTSRIIFTPQDIRKSIAKNFSLESKTIGVATIQFLNKDAVLFNQKINVVVNNRGLNNMFIAVITGLVIFNTIAMGAQLDLHLIVDVYRKPIGPLIGFVSQFVLMPGISFLVGYLLTTDKLFRLGLFILGCCPGGNGSNFWTLLLKGDIELSIVMTFVSTIAALAMMPLWLYLVGPILIEGELKIPFDHMIISLFGLILPITLGMFLRRKWPKFGEKLQKIIVPLTLLTVLFIMTVGVYINLFLFELITPLMIAAGFAVSSSGYMLGAGLAWLARLELSQITAVSVETAFQNGGIAFVLLKISFPEPLGELASIAPVAQLMITGIPLWILFGLINLNKYCLNRKDPHQYGKPVELQRI